MNRLTLCIYFVCVCVIPFSSTTQLSTSSKELYVGDYGPWSCDITIESKCSGIDRARCREGCSCCDEDGYLHLPCEHNGDHWEVDGTCNFCNGDAYKGPSNCECRDERFGTCCDFDCVMPEYCKYQQCSTLDDFVCTECHNNTGSNQAYFLNEKGRCLSKCNWLGHWCFPGTCDNDEDYLHTTCQCTEGFTLYNPDKETTKCLLSQKPDIVTCRIGAESPLGEVANSTFKNDSTSCQSTEDAYVNFEINHMSFVYSFSFELPEDPPSDEELHTYVDKFAFGVIDASDTIIYYNNIGIATIIDIHDSNDHPSDMCTVGNFHKDNPLSGMLLTCKLNSNYGDLSDMKDGEKVCHRFEVTAGGYVDIQDMGTGTPPVRNYYNTQKSTKEVCFNIDYTDPDHCTNLKASCNKDILSFGNRIRRELELNVTFDGWFDPPPKSNVSSQSGMKEYEIEIRDVIHTPTELHADFQSIATYISKGEGLNLTLPDRSQPSMYAIYIWALDSTQESSNYRIARRFVLTDNTSYVIKTEQHPILVTSASSATNLNWQTKISPVKLDWTKHFFNSWHVHTNLLLPIHADGNISGVFEQETGELPVSGTPNIDGITNFMYRYNRISEEGDFTSEFKNVLNPSREALTISEFQPIDGDWIDIYIKAVDIMNNTLDDMVTVKIDSTEPLIKDVLFVHHSTGISEMNITFLAYDPHSGLKTVFWKLGTDAGKSDIGNGSLPVVKINTNECGLLCYCPIINDTGCQLLSYSIILSTSNIIEVGEYHVTLIVTNEALLITKINVQLKDIKNIVTAPTPHAEDSNNGLIIGVSVFSGFSLLAAAVLFSISIIINMRTKKTNSSKSNGNTSDVGTVDYSNIIVGTTNVQREGNYNDDPMQLYENTAFERDYQQLAGFEEKQGDYEVLPPISSSQYG